MTKNWIIGANKDGSVPWSTFSIILLIVLCVLQEHKLLANATRTKQRFIPKSEIYLPLGNEQQMLGVYQNPLLLPKPSCGLRCPLLYQYLDLSDNYATIEEN